LLSEDLLGVGPRSHRPRDHTGTFF
jgi:hypothetical protein